MNFLIKVCLTIAPDCAITETRDIISHIEIKVAKRHLVKLEYYCDEAIDKLVGEFYDYGKIPFDYVVIRYTYEVVNRW